MIRFLKLLIALVSLPIIWGTLQAFIKTVSIFNPAAPDQIFFFIGLLAYPVFQVVCSKPLRTYVFGHELTHALASMLLGGKIKRFKVSKKGGSVVLSRTNFMVSLAPYIVPLYTVILIGLYVLLGWFVPIYNYYKIFIFLVGFSLSFHAALTVFAIKQRQPDITQTGILFSMTVIGCVSPWILVFILKALFHPLISISQFMRMVWQDSWQAYSVIIGVMITMWKKMNITN